ncbi:NAD(P)H-hydrate dehydratase [Gracilibacillus timonensis]|uniref:NAD(P)H-hydrate dehydratase n=1 Tax=Gracilibacillus timonensis TaxID=1816696 RepID=UPI000824B548|nr:NAD(P)H-hydrate dehydratase [Gracilibacillus timonensis]
MYIVTAKEMYEIDRYAIEETGIAGKILMENAGSKVAGALLRDYQHCHQVAIVVGSGNNGGDGFVVGRYLQESGLKVTLFQVVEDKKIKGDAAYHKQLSLQSGVTLVHVDAVSQLKEQLLTFDIIVDAILGIGVQGDIRQPIHGIIDSINQTPRPTISIDIPSGLPATDSEPVDMAIQANHTYIIATPKVSLFCEPLQGYYGSWQVLSIAIPNQAYVPIKKGVWQEQDVLATLPRRGIFSHKGSHGKGVVIGGQQTMPGSIALAARAALRSGAGLITAATVVANIPVVANYCTEATYQPLANMTEALSEEALSALASHDAIAVGMGMGRNNSQLLPGLLYDTDKPLLIDADGLYHLKTLLSSKWKRTAPVVISPHYGEMAMLTDQRLEMVKQAPFTLSKQFAEEHQVYIVLKGKHTIITSPDGQQIVSSQGNAGLAKGGTGDVLSGVLLTMLMQQENVMTALANGCYLHGRSAEILVEQQHSEVDLLASDVIEGLSQVFRTLS